MPYITVPDQTPGIRGLFMFKPSTGAALSALAQQMLRGPSSLTPGERETIAAFVSSRNDCEFCMRSHRAAAVAVIGEASGVDAVISDLDTAPTSDKMKALLTIAAKVQHSGLDVTEEDVAAARAAGAGDEDIHDAVLVAAAFCMYNRYVDGLRAITPSEQEAYDEMGVRLAEVGYMPPRPPEPVEV